MAKARVLVVEDEKLNINILISILEEDYDVVIAKNGEQAIKRVKAQLPDLILLDIVLPDMDGYQVFEKIQSLTADKIPIIFVTSKRSPEEEIKGLKLGAVDYITKPFTPSIVELRIANQIQYKRNRDELKRLNRTDALTGIPNRRHLDEYINQQKANIADTRSDISLIMIDVDHFKKFNDRYGHSAGDECLRRVAQALNNQIDKSTDFVARYGGEEFAIVLTQACPTKAFDFAKRLQRAVSEKQILHETSDTDDYVTISLGIATVPSNDIHSTVEDLFDRADKALYQAKVAGRNRLAVWSEV